MIKGTYILSSNGIEISRAENVITKFGKRFLTNYIAGNAIDGKKDIAIGIDTTSATNDDTRLGFEFYRLPVSFGSTNIQTVDGTTSYSVIFKATIPQDVSGVVGELGLYPSTKTSSNNYDSKFISDFSSNLDWLDPLEYNPAITYANSKINDFVLDMNSDTSGDKEYTYAIGSFNMTGYSPNDSIKLAYYKYDTRLDKITIKFYSTDSDYYYYDITPASGTGYKITDDILLSSVYGSFSGSPDRAQINKIGLVISTNTTSATKVGMDGLRINDEDTFDPNMGIISRAVITPFTKVAGQPIDIEYRLDLGF